MLPDIVSGSAGGSKECAIYQYMDDNPLTCCTAVHTETKNSALDRRCSLSFNCIFLVLRFRFFFSLVVYS